MRIIQFVDDRNGRCLGVVQGDQVVNVTARNTELTSTVQAFRIARRAGKKLEQLLQDVLHQKSQTSPLSCTDLLAAGRVLAPVTEEAGARLLVSGTGLTHLGSVQQRDTMHPQTQTQQARSDSRKMFDMGL